MKGSSLTESEAREVLAVLSDYDVVAEAVVMDVGEHDDVEVTALKNAQADRLTAHITRDHQPGLIQDVLSLQEDIRRLPNQLFLQVSAYWQLIPRLLETVTMYYSQRQPSELGKFIWRVDAKDRSVTSMEYVWTVLVGPVILTQSMSAPMAMVPSGDYSFYDRYNVAAPSGLDVKAGSFFTDLKMVLREDFAFVDSTKDLGVQLADLLASILTRALNNTLQPAGWMDLGRSFVRRAGSTVHVVRLQQDAIRGDSHEISNQHWRRVLTQLEVKAKGMLTRASLRMADDDGG